jgi:dTDP-glucose pyrophosphorylase
MKKTSCSWFEKPLKCVVLAAGKGSRAYPATLTCPKVLLPLHGVPAIRYIIDFWQQFTKDFIFVVGYKKEMVIDYVSTLDIRPEFVEQTELKGIAHAVQLARPLVTPNFILVLGDCYCNGTFKFPEIMDQGIGVWETKNEDYIKQSYSVEIDNYSVKRVVEKPKALVNDYCGMGFYFFNTRIFKYIQATAPSKLRNEIEITDAIQNMVSAGEPVTAVPFTGDYVNITYENDIDRIQPIE